MPAPSARTPHLSWASPPYPLGPTSQSRCHSRQKMQYISMHKIDQNIGESTSHTTKPPAYNSTTSACTHLVSSNKTQSSIHLIAIMQIHQLESAAAFPHNSVHSTDLQSGVDTLTARKTHMRDKFFCLLNSFWANPKTIKKKHTRPHTNRDDRCGHRSDEQDGIETNFADSSFTSFIPFRRTEKQ